MSEENVELVRKACDAFNASGGGEMTPGDIAELFDPQVEVHWHDERTMPTCRNISVGSQKWLGSERKCEAPGSNR